MTYGNRFCSKGNKDYLKALLKTVWLPFIGFQSDLKFFSVLNKMSPIPGARSRKSDFVSMQSALPRVGEIKM